MTGRHAFMVILFISARKFNLHDLSLFEEHVFYGILAVLFVYLNGCCYEGFVMSYGRI